MAFYDQMVAALNAMLREDAIPYMAKADKLTMKNCLAGLAPLAGAGVIVESFAGGAALSTHDVAYDIESVPVMMNVTAAGAVTFVVAPTAFTFSGKTITWVLDQSGDTMVCFYIPAKSWA